MKKISIILPVYNTENYLKKCLQSILNQTYPYFELIIINDGSTDGSESVVLEFAHDPRIIYQYLDNAGVYKARNYALKITTGDFVCFIDSDDWVDKDFLEDFVKNLSETKKRIVVQDLKRILMDGSIEQNVQGYKNELLMLPQDLEKYIANYKYTQGYLFNKIFIKEIISRNNIFFDEEMVANADEVFCFNYIEYIDEALFLDKDNYSYVERPGSITKKFPTFHSALKHLIGFKNFSEYLIKNKNSEVVENYINKKYSHIFDHLLRNCIYRNSYSQKERRLFLRKLYRETKSSLNFLSPNSSLKKIDYFLFKNKHFKVLDSIITIKTRIN